MQLVQSVVGGIKLGLMFAAAYTVIALGLFAITGGASLDRSAAMLVRVIAVYAAGGIVSGAAFGLLRPLARWMIGAGVLGMLLAIPAYAGMRFAVKGFVPWTAEDTSDVLVLSTLIGGIGGMLLRYRLIKRGIWTPK